jgi:transposase
MLCQSRFKSDSRVIPCWNHKTIPQRKNYFSAYGLKPVLVQCAWAAARKRNSYFQAQLIRLKARCGAKKAVIAVAASILTTAYHMLADGTCYQDLGPDHFARRDPARLAKKLAERIRNLGYRVDIRPAA